jgi:poly(hydroxyalkanoate) granule-associated protein
MADEIEQAKTVAEAKAVAGKGSEPNPFVDAVHKILLAGIGAMALAQDEVEEFVGRLVERGELAEADGKKLVKDVMERRKGQMKDEVKKVEDGFDKRVEAILARMNIPTKDEIAALNARIATLTQKVDELKKAA